MKPLIINDGDKQVWIAQKHGAYVWTIAMAFDHFWGAVVAENGVADFSQPKLHRVVGFDDFPLLIPSLPEPWETCQQYLDFARIQPGQMVFDLGGYCGLTAIAFAKAGARVVVLEPDPENHRACSINLARFAKQQGPHPVVLLNSAIAPERGRIQFNAEGAPGSGNASIVGARGGDAITVQAVTLDDLAREFGAPDFIKIDIEGAEYDLIRGAAAFFSAHRPRLVMEAHQIGGRHLEDDLCRLLTGYGYDCQIVRQTGHFFPLVTAEPGAVS